MNEALQTERGLRLALLGIGALIALGTAVELLMIGHVEPGPQLIPLALSAAALLGAAMLYRAPSPRVLTGLRGVAVLLALGGAFGSFEHMEHNYAFEEEIRPAASFSEKAREAFFGANPLLAPGAYVGIAMLLAAATWRHPATR